MKRERQVVAICMVTTCALTLLVMMLAFFGYPQTTWRLLRRFLWILGLSEVCAAGLGYGLGRYAVSSLSAELEEKQSRLRLYLSETGHELRTPLTVMHGSIDILRGAVRTADLTALGVLDGLAQETARLLNLVQKVLLLARLDVLRRPVVRELDIAAAVHRIADWGRSRAPETAIDVEVEAGLSTAVDEAAFLEAIRILVDNALLYAPGTPIRIVARSQNRHIAIEVADDGPGMDVEDAVLAFERYYRGAGAQTVAGAGLGLSIVQAMAERHGGTATIKSDHEGTIVTLLLARAES